MTDPHLVTVAHGTRHATGNDVARELTAGAARLLGWPATAAYVELSEPLFADVVRAAGSWAGSSAGSSAGSLVVVPLLLSTGYHVQVDLPEMAAGSPVPVRMGRPLGPDPALAEVAVERLVAAGATSGQRVVLVAAGSSDEAATSDQLGAVALLARAWGGPVELATLSGRGRRPEEVVRPDDAVSPYLLSPGYFVDRIRAEVPAGVVVADVLGPHERLVRLVAERARSLAASTLER